MTCFPFLHKWSLWYEERRFLSFGEDIKVEERCCSKCKMLERRFLHAWDR